MTEDELTELLAGHPVLYHMAEAGSWPSIRERGLLSTSALLDLFGVGVAERHAIEAERRPLSVALAPGAVIRDNGPLNEANLARCLDDGLRPEDWYRLLNGRVFFWLSRERLLRLLGARLYRGKEHEVLEVEARPLVEACRDRIELSPINSGATGRFPVRRGLRTFRRIPDYDYASRRARRLEPVVELAVLGGVPDIARFTRRVVRMRGDREEGVVWEAPGVGPGLASGGIER
ncbi:MAG TPA: hypothetical protein VM899_11755 [Rubellimicrobium sp.]|nr:hypothetical protein [Rubellimicrobium sp.]